MIIIKIFPYVPVHFTKHHVVYVSFTISYKAFHRIMNPERFVYGIVLHHITE
jgi:hypothetical protein